MIARFGRFAVDSGARQLTRDGNRVHLTPKAFDLLLLLIDEAPRVVRKDEIHRRLWPGTFVVDSTLAGVVKAGREALTQDLGPLRAVRPVRLVAFARHRTPNALGARADDCASRARRGSAIRACEGRRIRCGVAAMTRRHA